MQIIKELEELIEDEIHDIKKYAKMAAAIKNDHPALSHVLYTISTQEDSHQEALHNEVVKMIEQHKRTHGDPPAAMMAVYDILHKRAIDKLAEARRYQDIYKET